MLNLFSSKIVFIFNIVLKVKIIRTVLFIFFKNKTKRSILIKMDLYIQKYFYNYLIYRRGNCRGEDNKLILHAKKKMGSKKIIWQYWNTGFDKIPDVVELCYKSVDKYCKDFIIIRLNDKNLKEYIDIPDYIVKKYNEGFIKPAHYSDIIRLTLLKYYGGVWLDSTIFLSNPIPKKLIDSDVFMFQRSNLALNKDFWVEFNPMYFSWGCNHKVNVLNSFISAKKENPLISELLSALMDFWYFNNKEPHYFIFQIACRYFMEKYRIDPILDDTIPHLLHTIINDDLDTEKINAIFEVCFIHKLGYDCAMEERNNYSYLKKFILQA